MTRESHMSEELRSAEHEDKTFLVRELIGPRSTFSSCALLPDGRMFLVMDEKLYLFSVDEWKMQPFVDAPPLKRLFVTRDFFAVYIPTTIHCAMVRVDASTMRVDTHQLPDGERFVDIDMLDAGRTVYLTTTGFLRVWEPDNSVKQKQIYTQTHRIHTNTFLYASKYCADELACIDEEGVIHVTIKDRDRATVEDTQVDENGDD
jgi:hypothetical protein